MTGVAHKANRVPAPLPVNLPDVTVCAVTSVNVAATVQAVIACLAHARFAACKIFTDSPLQVANPDITVVPIERITSSAAYSDFVLNRLVEHVDTSHCLIVQWDGYVIDGSRWRSEFLAYDYMGARWPQFDDGHDVGNGGFSLRSKRLMEACLHREFMPIHPEDLAIGRKNRPWLEAKGMRFAPRDLADAFSAERTGNLETSFGYHGVFNMPATIGVDAFWERYLQLDERTTVWTDLDPLLRMLADGAAPTRRRMRLIADCVKDAIRARLS
jgi:hypothetical protein